MTTNTASCEVKRLNCPKFQRQCPDRCPSNPRIQAAQMSKQSWEIRWIVAVSSTKWSQAAFTRIEEWAI